MKKIFIIFILLLSICTYSNAEYAKFEDWETGDMYNYEVYNFDEMFSVFEDLNSEYDDLIEEYHSLEINNEELSSELQIKNNEIKKLEEELYNKSNVETEDESYIFIKLFLFLLIIYIVIYFIRKVFLKK